MIRARIEFADLEMGLNAAYSEIMAVVDANLLQVAKAVRDDAVATTEFDDGPTKNLRNSIRLKKSKFKDGGYIVAARGKNKDLGYHAHLVEFGHVMIAWGRVTGDRVRPHKFMRKAKESGIKRAYELFRSKT